MREGEWTAVIPIFQDRELFVQNSQDWVEQMNTRRKLNRLESHEQKRHKNPRSGQSENSKTLF